MISIVFFYSLPSSHPLSDSINSKISRQKHTMLYELQLTLRNSIRIFQGTVHSDNKILSGRESVCTKKEHKTHLFAYMRNCTTHFIHKTRRNCLIEEQNPVV